MAKAEKKILGVLPKQGTVGVIVGGLVAALVLALLWGYFLKKSIDMTTGEMKSSLLVIVLLLLLAALIGLIVGILANEVKKSTLWVAAGLGVLAVAWAKFMMVAYLSQVAIDDAILESMESTALDLTGPAVTLGTIVLAAVAAASVSLAKWIKL
jgi:hypothetical protein